MALKHGQSRSRLYHIWQSFKNRCNNINCQAYKNYGGRGIKVCPEWRDNFKAFYDWAIVNNYQENLTLDRINVLGNYEPSNCRWTTYKIQERNRRNNKYVTYKTQTHCLSEWAEIYDISYNALKKRLKRGWSFEEAIKGTRNVKVL